MADCLNNATAFHLEKNKSPSRRVNEIDNRGSHYYLGLFWARELSKQTDNPELAKQFKALEKQLMENKRRIIAELDVAQGNPVDIGGYYFPDPVMAERAMRPSPILNEILENM